MNQTAQIVVRVKNFTTQSEPLAEEKSMRKRAQMKRTQEERKWKKNRSHSWEQEFKTPAMKEKKTTESTKIWKDTDGEMTITKD